MLRPKPKPRMTLTATMTPSDACDSRARAGTPSNTAPKTSRVLYANRFIRIGAANSAATVPSSRTPVTRPAPALPEPAAAAYTGVTESIR